MRKLICLSAGILMVKLLAMPSLLSGNDYTLDDLYRIALERSEKIMVSEENLNIAKMGANKARAVLIPKLSAYGTYTQYTENKWSDKGSVLQPNNANSWGLRLDQSFSLSGRDFTALDVAGENVEKSRYDLLTVKEDYLVNIALAFYDVLKAKKALEIADANLDRLSRYRNAAHAKLKVGEATKTALLRVEGELSGARSEKIKAVNTREAAKVLLAKAAGLEGNFDVKEAPEANSMPSALTELKRLAISQRVELKSLDFQKKINEKQVTYAKGSFWPSLSLAAVYARADQDPSSSTMNRDSIYGSIALNLPIYEGGLRKAEVLEAEARLRQSELLYRDAVKSIAVEVEMVYLDLATQQGIINFLQTQLVYARDNFNAVSKQYEFGLANSIDIIDANNALLSAQRQLVDADYNARFFMLKLKKATGSLLREKAKEIN
jgi:outer membrane protein